MKTLDTQAHFAKTITAVEARHVLKPPTSENKESSKAYPALLPWLSFAANITKGRSGKSSSLSALSPCARTRNIQSASKLMPPAVGAAVLANTSKAASAATKSVFFPVNRSGRHARISFAATMGICTRARGCTRSLPSGTSPSPPSRCRYDCGLV